jgi:high-affinity nickel-transport protein
VVVSLGLVWALGLRHGLDADHLAAIDGLSRMRPSKWNGVVFALGHGGVVTALAVGAGELLDDVDLGALTPWLFVAIAVANAWRLFRPHAHARARFPVVYSPLLLGMLLAVGFETSSQLAALSLSARVSPLYLGVAFTVGMVCSDGLDGWLASRVQQGGGGRAKRAGVILGWAVVLASLALAGAEFAGLDLESVSLPLGLLLLVALVGLRLWSLRPAVPGGAEGNTSHPASR